ncbi:MAG: hypothetical protein ACYTEE_01865, partial [Planctomycetota bacterium]
QAGRMYEYFHKFLKKGFEDLVKKVKKTPTQKTIFKNGAMVEVLIQSEKSVRGQHVHKLRCDEIEMFNASVYEAAQYTTISTKGYKGAIEVISTKNTNYGLMAKVLKKSKEQGKRIFKWNVWDVVKRCRNECAECILNTACEGKARKGRGYLRIDDVINQLKRTSKAKFNLEILCSEASQSSGWGYSFGERLY